MPAGFAFQSELVARALRDSVGAQTLPVTKPTMGLTFALGFETPGGGIPAFSGTTPGKADCTPYYISVDATTGVGTWTELKDESDASQTFTVYNYVEAAIAGSTKILAVKIFEVWCIASQDCG